MGDQSLSRVFSICLPQQTVNPAWSPCLQLRAPQPTCTPPTPSIPCLHLRTFTRPRQQGHPQASSVRRAQLLPPLGETLPFLSYSEPELRLAEYLRRCCCPSWARGWEIQMEPSPEAESSLSLPLKPRVMQVLGPKCWVVCLYPCVHPCAACFCTFLCLCCVYPKHTYT